ncbi:hypothetical protein OSB04_007318 [Centaurea solstitialis]|uniref:Retrotransposon gag domain-containing protein n=1 Tax=Centaurea solstitialis TaxID=347529 RepID=A0AA38TS93_9ASTR|nr:hypothetical protein OSB04_007318 [Centaurea solstitialis]
MVTTRRSNGRPSGEGKSEIPGLRGIITAEVGEVPHELLPGIFEQMKRELTQVVTQQVETAMARRRNEAGSSQSGHTRMVEGVFLTSFCPTEVKVRVASNLLRGPTKDWWNVIARSRTPEQIGAMTWEDFIELFKTEFEPQIEVERLTSEFLPMTQTNDSE